MNPWQESHGDEDEHQQSRYDRYYAKQEQQTEEWFYSDAEEQKQ